MIRRVAFSMYPVTDVPRAKEFYEGLLGLTPGNGSGEVGGHPGMLWVEYDLPEGGCLAITNVTDETPGPHGGSIGLEVEDLDALMSSLQAAGVAFKSEVIRGPKCRLAVCLDPDGNSIILHQFDQDES
ncbi:MAG: VOC family protein [Planctomycetota bacterium]|jgi:predicted enzyme related to lactoylglutathione lyase